MVREGRLLEERSWAHYNGYNVAFRPRRMPPDALLAAHRELWRRAFAPAAVAARIARGARQLRAGGLMLSASMNGFHGLKRLTGNLPAEARDQPDTPRIAHPAPTSDPARISLRIARPTPPRELASGER